MRAGSADEVQPGATVRGRALPDPIETITALDVGPAVESTDDDTGTDEPDSTEPATTDGSLSNSILR